MKKKKWEDSHSLEELRLQDDEPIHTWFGLSYANYLVLPRSVMQVMSVAWQRSMVKLLDQVEADVVTKWHPEGGYRVNAVDAKGRFIKDQFSQYRHGEEISVRSRKAEGK